jgi:hypothetical protein
MSSVEEREPPGATGPGGAPAALDDRRRRAGRGRCRLGEAAGRSFLCEDACAFWEPGGAVVPPGCLLDRVPLDLRRQPESMRVLVELKERLESAGPARDRGAAHARLAALVECVMHGEKARR